VNRGGRTDRWPAGISGRRSTSPRKSRSADLQVRRSQAGLKSCATSTVRSRLHVLAEPIQRALPGQLRGGLVVTRRRVVVEAVVGLRIDVSLVRDVVAFRAFARRPPAGEVSSSPRWARIAALISNIRRRRSRAVKGTAAERSGIRTASVFTTPPPKQNPLLLAGRVRTGLEPRRRSHEIPVIFGRSTWPNSCPPPRRRRIPADGCEPVGANAM
jgi:hypothetical protein